MCRHVVQLYNGTAQSTMQVHNGFINDKWWCIWAHTRTVTVTSLAFLIYHAWSVNLHLTSLYWKSTRLLQGFLRAHVWAIKCSLPKVHLKTKSYDLYCMTVLRVSDTVGCAFKGKASTHKGEKRKKRRWWWFRTQSKMGSAKLDEERSKINVVDTTKSLLCRKFQHNNIEYILAFNLYAGNFRSKCPCLN